MENYYTNKEIQKIFNITPRTLQNWRDLNKIKFIQIGYKIYYEKEYINNLIKIKDNSSGIKELINDKIDEIVDIFNTEDKGALNAHQYTTKQIIRLIKSFKV